MITLKKVEKSEIKENVWYLFVEKVWPFVKPIPVVGRGIFAYDNIVIEVFDSQETQIYWTHEIEGDIYEVTNETT